MTHRILLPGLLLAAGLAVGAPALPADAAAPERPAASATRFRLATREAETVAAPRAFAKAAAQRRRAGSAPLAAAAGDELAPRPGKVFGPDDRYPVADPAAYPWSSVCKVFAEFPDGSLVEGSAVLVGGRHALTAGHVVYDADLGGFAESVEVVPAYDFGDAPFGRYAADDITAFTGWTRDADLDWDFALLTLDGAAGDAAGWLGMSVYGDFDLADLTVNTAGYPGDLDDGRAMFAATGTVASVLPGQIQMRGELDAARGQSGSGVWVRRDDGRYVLGVLSSETATANRAARITGDVFDAISSWIDAGGPDFVADAVRADVPSDVELPASFRAVATVANDGDEGAVAEVAIVARDVRGRRTVLASRDVRLGAGEVEDEAFTVSLGAGFAPGTWVLEAEVNGDRAVAETDLDDNVRAGPSFVALPAFRTAVLGVPTWDALDPGGVARYRMSVPAGLRRMRLQLSAGRGGFAVVTRPDGSRFTVPAGGRTVTVPAPQPGLWLVDIRIPASAPRARGVTFRTLPGRS